MGVGKSEGGCGVMVGGGWEEGVWWFLRERKVKGVLLKCSFSFFFLLALSLSISHTRQSLCVCDFSLVFSFGQ